MSDYKRRIDVMISSTTLDLGEHRRRVALVVNSLLFTPRIMDLDSATGKDGIRYSLDLVEEAEIYILLLGFRYGNIPKDTRNPEGLSMTHLEYRRAKERQARGELCVLPFLVVDSQHLPEGLNEEEESEEKRRKVEAFRREVLEDQVAFFASIEELEKKVALSLQQSPCVQTLKTIAFTESDKIFSPKNGEVLDERYIFVCVLGSGETGEVWLAKEKLPDGITTVDVAIKILKRDISKKTPQLERFKEEISIARRLTSAHIIRTTSWGRVGDQLYAVMDYVEGQILTDYIANKLYTPEETAEMLGQIAEGLDHARNQGMKAHRAVRPDNILVNNGHLWLSDYGLTISEDDLLQMVESNEFVKAKKYWAPEQWDFTMGDVGYWSDIYALGIIAYEMLTGHFPYNEINQTRLSFQHIQDTLPKSDLLADAIWHILNKACSKVPSQRYNSATDFILDLKYWKEDPANLETKIHKYLDELNTSIKGSVYEQLFVNLEGEHHLIHLFENRVIQASPDDNLMDLLGDLVVKIEAQHSPPKEMSSESNPEPDVLGRLMKTQRAVLLGEPGSGKTFMLNRLIVEYIKAFRNDANTSDSFGWYVPVFVRLNVYKGEQYFIDYVKNQMGKLAAYHDELCNQGRLVILCDALNEMQRSAPELSGNEGVRDLLTELIQYLLTSPRFVVSCRVLDYRNDLEKSELRQLERIELKNMDLPTIYEFYQKTLGQDASVFWERIGGSENLFRFWYSVGKKGEPQRFWDASVNAPSYTSGDEDRAWLRMWEGAKLIPLSRNPYMAGMIRKMHKDQNLPENRAKLYERFFSKLYDHEAELAKKRQEKSFPSQDKVETFLTALADIMQARQATTLTQKGLQSLLDTSLLQTCLDMGVLNKDTQQTQQDTITIIRFSHQLLQEYFSARSLANKLHEQVDPRRLLGKHWWDIRAWRETSLMLVELTQELNLVTRWLAQASPELAIEIYLNARPISELDDTTKGAILKGALKKFNQDIESNPLGRAAAGRALGLIGDPRFGVGCVDVPISLRSSFYYGETKRSEEITNSAVRALIPDIDWVKVPAGEFTYQDTRVSIPYDYEISRYPVSYEQFQAFLDDPEGYKDINRWFEGWVVDENIRKMNEQRFKYANHPRDSINWFHAMAFCRWLSWRIRGVYDLDRVHEWVVRLPTAHEWEKAARADTGWQYPYGNEFDANKGNTEETGIGMTSAVGCFPHGASPYGVLDMSGNVWQWCLTEFATPLIDVREVNLRSSSARELRGGSWNNNANDAKATYRGRLYPTFRFIYRGFRIVRIQP